MYQEELHYERSIDCAEEYHVTKLSHWAVSTEILIRQKILDLL